MTDFSHAAQAVLDASNLYPCNDSRQIIAATLRAAANQVLAAEWEGQIQPDTTHMLGINWSRDALLAIAAELESADV